MPTPAFDDYLAHVTRLLAQRPRAGRDIAGELRDHLESRCEELVQAGCSADEAVQRALEELGPVAPLAAEFAKVFQEQQRRWIMRITTGAVVGGLTLVMAGLTMWPVTSDPDWGPLVQAQAPAQPGPESAEITSPKETTPEENNAKTEQRMAQRFSVDLNEAPLHEVLDFVTEVAKIQFYVNRVRLAEQNISLDVPVTISLKDVRADMVLDLALSQVGHLEYMLRDGIVVISTADDLNMATEVRVYDCRDLLRGSGIAPFAGRGGYPGGPSMGRGAPGAGIEEPGSPGPAGEDRSPGNLPPGIGSAHDQAGSGLPGGGGYPGDMPVTGYPGMSGGRAPVPGGMHRGNPLTSDPSSVANKLVQVVQGTIEPDSWQDAGGYGTIEEFSGLLVINHNVRVHRRIEELLKMLRVTMQPPKTR